jgi:hypothetical protein
MIPAAAPAVIALVCSLLPAYWTSLTVPSTVPAQIEQETCVSLTSRYCFSPRAELKTSREYGFGLGQLTVTPTFNNFTTVRGQVPALRNWTWSDRFDPKNQVIALLHMNAQSAKFCATQMDPVTDTLACTFAIYNGGLGGFRSDRRVCSNTKGCDPRRWFGNVANTSLKAKKPVNGYGQSFFQINRNYVTNILLIRSPKYVPLTEKLCQPSPK